MYIAPIQTADPFLITGPAVISVSGGRTSAYMLWRVLQAHNGVLPADVVAVFANTGREMEGTLDFVRDMGEQWDVPITWLEFRGKNATGFAEVTHATASRNGEPFALMLAGQQYLPSPVQRGCTQELKIRTIKRWAMHARGWRHWKNVVGLRADEPRRVENARRVGPKPKPAAGDLLLPEPAAALVAKPRRTRRDRWAVELPLADASVTKADVMEFWKGRNFDLRLAGPWQGNCDGCFLKSMAAVARMFQDFPERMAWWIEMEAVRRGTAGRGRFFRRDRRYATIAEHVRQSPRLVPDETMVEGGEACDGGCGI